MVHLSHRIRKLQLSGYNLEKVLTHKEAIFTRLCRRVGRTAQVKNRHWPVKSTKIVLDLLDNAEGNAEVKGLDVISHIRVKSSSEANTPNLPSPSKGKPYVCDVIYQNGTGHNYTDMIFPHDFPSIIERAKFGELEGLVAKAERVYDGNIRVRMLNHVFGGGVCLYGFWSREQQKVFQKHMSAMKLKIDEMKVADSKHSSDIEHLTKNDEKLAKEVDQLKTEDRKLATEVEGVTKGLIPCIIRLTPSTEHLLHVHSLFPKLSVGLSHLLGKWYCQLLSWQSQGNHLDVTYFTPPLSLMMLQFLKLIDKTELGNRPLASNSPLLDLPITPTLKKKTIRLS